MDVHKNDTHILIHFLGHGLFAHSNRENNRRSAAKVLPRSWLQTIVENVYESTTQPIVLQDEEFTLKDITQSLDLQMPSSNGRTAVYVDPYTNGQLLYHALPPGTKDNDTWKKLFRLAWDMVWNDKETYRRNNRVPEPLATRWAQQLLPSVEEHPSSVVVSFQPKEKQFEQLFQSVSNVLETLGAQTVLDDKYKWVFTDENPASRLVVVKLHSTVPANSSSETVGTELRIYKESDTDPFATLRISSNNNDDARQAQNRVLFPHTETTYILDEQKMVRALEWQVKEIYLYDPTRPGGKHFVASFVYVSV